MLLLRSPVIFQEDTTFFYRRASRVISAATGSPFTGMVFGISAVFWKKICSSSEMCVLLGHGRSHREREKEREGTRAKTFICHKTHKL